MAGSLGREKIKSSLAWCNRTAPLSFKTFLCLYLKKEEKAHDCYRRFQRSVHYLHHLPRSNRVLHSLHVWSKQERSNWKTWGSISHRTHFRRIDMRMKGDDRRERQWSRSRGHAWTSHSSRLWKSMLSCVSWSETFRFLHVDVFVGSKVLKTWSSSYQRLFGLDPKSDLFV